MKRSIRWICFSCLMLIFAFSMVIQAAPRVSLRFAWWGGEVRHRATMDAIALYMKKNPNVRINGEYMGFNGYQQKILTQLSGRTAPDIMQIDQPWVGDLISQGDLFLDMHKIKELQLSGFDKNFLKNQCEWNGQLIGLPTGLNGLTYFVNKDFFAKYQIPANIEWDWDKLIEVGAQVQSRNKKAHLLMMDVNHVGLMMKMYIKQHNGSRQWVNDDFSLGFDQKILAQAFAYYQKLLQSGTIAPLEETALFELKMEQNPAWIAGEIGLAQNQASSTSLYKLNGRINLDAARLPVLKNAKTSGIIVRPSQLLVINKRTSNAKEAAKFLNWFFNDPEAILILKAERGIPATMAGRKVLEENKLIDPIMAKAIKLAVENAGYPENDISNNKELMTIYGEYIQKVGFNKLTPEAAADQMIKDYQKKLVDLKTKL